jgi:uncharacterized repeat protein (TIGR03803 family)
MVTSLAESGTGHRVMKAGHSAQMKGAVHLALLALVCCLSSASAADALVIFEAESGALGSDFAVSNSSSPAFITITTDNAGSNPGSAARVASYSVTFPAAGTYQVYARIRVGPGNFNDDSLFYATSFGVKSPTNNSDWVLVNGLASAGFTNSADVVTGGGTLGSGMWKWINLSQKDGNVSFTVNAGGLTQTFQIGARENGLDMDKFAFGTLGTSFTVSNLDTGTLPSSPALTNNFPGPDGIALHRFNPLSNGLNLDGANPAAGLALSGNLLCGTTLNGGLQGAGTAFYVSLDGTNFNAFRSFNPGASDAGNAQGNLVISSNNLYGTTIAGGSKGVGTVFLANTNGSTTVLRSFSAVSADNATNFGGASPSGRLVLSGNMLYGTAAAGDASANGAVFALSTNGAVFSVLHDFSALDSNAGTNSDGAAPCGGLVLAGNRLYGTASAGGAGGAGVIFSVATNGSNFTALRSFTSLDPLTATNGDGAFPFGGLIVADGRLYGAASAGGAGGNGVIFSVGTNGLDFAVLRHFPATDSLSGTNSDGALPCASLALSSRRLYGTATRGGRGASGTVFSIGTDGSQFRTIYNFTAVSSATGTNRDGAFPVAPVLPVGDSLYGTAFGGGPGGVGTVFKVDVPSPAVVTDVFLQPTGDITLYFLGLPNSTNVIQAAPALTPPDAWRDIATNVADADGAWEFTENVTTNSSRFYRSYVPEN